MDTDKRGLARGISIADGSIVLSGLIHYGILLVFIRELRAIRGSMIFNPLV